MSYRACGPLPPARSPVEDSASLAAPLARRVLWAGVEGDTAALAAVQDSVERVCVGLGWPADEQHDTPHITLARARGKLADRDALAALLDRRAGYVYSRFEVNGITLYASRSAPGGAIYSPLFRRALGEGGPPL